MNTPPLLQIFSHPRSGTHLLANFVALNFYQGVDLALTNTPSGHWANRKTEPRIEAGKLMHPTAHKFPGIRDYFEKEPRVYIVRDGRAVAYSLWKTENFMNAEWGDISFSEFLSRKIDWHASPGYPARPRQTIAQHWRKHVAAWTRLAGYNKNVLLVRFEQLLSDPEEVHSRLITRFPFLQKMAQNEVRFPEKLVGISPNTGKPKGWKDVFSVEDEELFLKSIPPKYRNYLN